MRSLILLIALMTFAASTSEAQPKIQSAQTKEPSQAEQRGSDKSPLVVRIIAPQDGEQKTAKEEEYRKEKAQEDRRLVWATIWLAFVTTALAIFTAFLWLSTKRLVVESKNTAKRQLRAYVFYRPVLPVYIPTLAEWHTVGMRFMIHNNGQTPAYDLRQVTNVGLRPSAIDIELHPVDFDEDGSRFVLNPGMHSEQVMRTDGPISQENIARFRARTHALYVWGEARYKDAFGDPQWCRYAFQISGEGEGSGNIHWCARGNEAS